MPLCPYCKRHGFHPEPVGRPRSIDRKRIAALLAKGMSYAAIGRELGVTKQRIGQIVKELKGNEK